MIPSKSNQENSTILMNKHEVAALRLKFLTPLVAAIVSLVIIFAIGLFYFESESRSYGLILPHDSGHGVKLPAQTVSVSYTR